MRNSAWLTALAILFLVAQCKKEKGEYALQGTVTHGRTGAAIANVALNVQKQVVTGSTYSSVYSPAANTNSDGSGFYSMKWERENFAKLKVVANYPQFISKEQELNVSSFSVGTPYQQNLALYPEAYVQMNIQNMLPAANTDKLTFTFVNANFDCFCCSNGYKIMSGLTDTAFTCKLYGDQWLKYQCNFNLGGPDSLVVDSVWCAAFQTTPVYVQY